jgi:hypothetical protein
MERRAEEGYGCDGRDGLSGLEFLFAIADVLEKTMVGSVVWSSSAPGPPADRMVDDQGLEISVSLQLEELRMQRNEVPSLVAGFGSGSVSGAREMNALGSSLRTLLTWPATRRWDTLDFESTTGLAGGA